MHILPADLDDPRVLAMLRTHLQRARAETAEGSAHALDVSGLRAPGIDVWAAWEGDALRGLGALKRLSTDHGEVKSMYVADEARRRGVAGAMLAHIAAAARAAGLARLSLETGSWPYFGPAVALYARHGFVPCPPFGTYRADPNSLFFTLDLAPVTGATPPAAPP